MTSSPNLPQAWRKSSRSASGPNQNCIEVGSWRKSTRSASGADQNCVEVGPCTCHGVAIRDSKLPTTGDFPTLSVTRTEWTALLAAVKTDALD